MITVTIRTSLMTPPDLRGAVHAALQQSVDLVAQRARDFASGMLLRRRTGGLVRAINTRIEPRPGALVGIVGVARRGGFQALWLEEGARPHSLRRGAALAQGPSRRRPRGRRARRGQRQSALAIPVGGQVIFRASARHPGLPPRRFLARAAEGATAQIRALFTAEVTKAYAAARRPAGPPA